MAPHDHTYILQRDFYKAFLPASAGLTCFFAGFSSLHLASLQIISFDELKLLLGEKQQFGARRLFYTSLPFHGDLEGEALCVMDELSITELVRLGMGKDGIKHLDEVRLFEPLRAVGGVLAACGLGALGDELQLVLFTPMADVLPEGGLLAEEEKSHWLLDAVVVWIVLELEFSGEKVEVLLFYVLDVFSYKQLRRRLQVEENNL